MAILIILLIISLIMIIYYRLKLKKADEAIYKRDEIIRDCFASLMFHGLMKYEDGVYKNIAAEVERKNESK